MFDGREKLKIPSKFVTRAAQYNEFHPNSHFRCVMLVTYLTTGESRGLSVLIVMTVNMLWPAFNATPPISEARS